MKRLRKIFCIAFLGAWCGVLWAVPVMTAWEAGLLTLVSVWIVVEMIAEGVLDV